MTPAEEAFNMSLTIRQAKRCALINVEMLITHGQDLDHWKEVKEEIIKFPL